MTKPNIVFILTDQWRAQAFGYAGDPNVKTPHIDALAERSLNCENTISVCPVCTPQRASLLTGRYPTTTGMFLNDIYLPKEEYCMAEMFKEAGYNTAYIGKWHLDGHGRYSFTPRERRQGFDYWKALECTHTYEKSYYYAGDDDTRLTWDGYDAYPQTEDAKTYIRDHADDDTPFLLFMGYGGPHFPHNNAPEELQALYPPESIQLRPNVPEDQFDHSRKELQGYYAHCTAIDACVGDLFAAVEKAGILDNTIFVFTSDHGDMHGSQGKGSWRKQLPWDESLCVPFLMHYPKIHTEGRVVRTTLNTPDILPSLLSLCDIEIPGTIEGDDVSSFLKGAEEDLERAGLFMTVAPFSGKDFEAFRGVRTSRYTYVSDSDGPWLFYDNQEDPYQMNNLLNNPDHAEIQASLDVELHRRLHTNNDSLMTAEDAREKWGYVVGKGGAIPYYGEFVSQSPGPDGGVPCSYGKE